MNQISYMDFKTPTEFGADLAKLITNVPNEMFTISNSETISKHLSEIAEVCFRLSLKQEEGRFLRGAFRINLSNAYPKNTSKILPPIELSVSQATRFLPSLKEGMTFVSLGFRDDKVIIIGITDDWLHSGLDPVFLTSNFFAIYTQDRVEFRIDRPGAFTTFLGSYILEYDSGEVRHRLSLVEFAELFNRLKKICDDASATVLLRFLGRLLTSIRKANHGGCLLIESPKSINPFGSVKPKYKIELESIVPNVMKVAKIQKGLMRKRDESNNEDYISSELAAHLKYELMVLDRTLAHQVILLANLANVDGCVLLNHDLKPLGYGARVEIEDDAKTEVDTFYTSEQYLNKTPVKAPMDRLGLRHLAAYSFCKKEDGRIAIVISQDGELRVFISSENNVSCYESFDAIWCSSAN